MSKVDTTKIDDQLIRDMFEIGAHFGYSRRRRHPSVDKFVFAYKNKNAVINLEKTKVSLMAAQEFVKSLGQAGKQILFVGNKNEAQGQVKKFADTINMPYVAERWIGGTLTNNSQIKNRLKRLAEIKADEETDALGKYTKKERSLIMKEKRDLERFFGGIVEMNKLPAAMFVVDASAEQAAILEAKRFNIPVISLSSSDCDIRDVDYPIIANDASVASIGYFLRHITESYKEGQKEGLAKKEEEKASIVKTEDK